MGTLVSIDNRLLAPRSAKVEVFDRGFLYGDSVYEALRTYGGFPFAWDEHLARLHRSSERTGVRIPVSDGELTARLSRALREARNPESQVRLIVTRGAGRLGLDPQLATQGRVMFLVRPLPRPPAELYQRGVSAVLTKAASGDPAAKTGRHLEQVVAMGLAGAHGANEALMVDAAGNVTEGVSSNVFVALGSVLVTPPAAAVLEGVTRRRVLALARREGMRLEERALSTSELSGADELFLTSTTREILPVVRVDEVAIGSGEPGPLTKRLMLAFRAAVEAWVAEQRARR